MGQGIDLAREDSPLHAALLDNLKDQLLIVFLKRLDGNVVIPVLEIDDTGQDLLAFSVDPKSKDFRFELRKKS